MFTYEQIAIWMHQGQPGKRIKRLRGMGPSDVVLGRSDGPLKCAKEDIHGLALSSEYWRG